MTQALRHAIYSAILNTEATAAFMFLPGSSLIARANLCYNDPESCPNQEIPLSQHNWDLHIIAVWNTAARKHLDNRNPAWLQGLATAVSEAKWKLRS
eukprot:1122522-Pelagomonas_calceolata.AAC.1